MKTKIQHALLYLKTGFSLDKVHKTVECNDNLAITLEKSDLKKGKTQYQFNVDKLLKSFKILKVLYSMQSKYQW